MWSTSYIHPPALKNPEYWSHARLGRLKEAEIAQTDPHHPRIPDPDELNSESNFNDIGRFLWFTNATLECHTQEDREEAGDPPFHPEARLSPWILKYEPISFVDGQERSNWAATGDLKKFQTFNYFFRQDPDHWALPSESVPFTRAAFFVTKSKSWVGKRNKVSKETFEATIELVRDIDWHAFACILEPKGRPEERLGFRLFVYDCRILNQRIQDNIEETVLSPPFETIHISKLFPMAQRFIEFIRTTRVIDAGDIWVLGSNDGNPNGQCVSRTAWFLQQYLSRWIGWRWTTKHLQRGGWFQVDETPTGRPPLLPGRRRFVPESFESPVTRSQSPSSGSTSRAVSPAGSIATSFRASSRGRRKRKEISRQKSKLALSEGLSAASDILATESNLALDGGTPPLDSLDVGTFPPSALPTPASSFTPTSVPYRIPPPPVIPDDFEIPPELDNKGTVWCYEVNGPGDPASRLYPLPARQWAVIMNDPRWQFVRFDPEVRQEITLENLRELERRHIESKRNERRERRRQEKGKQK